MQDNLDDKILSLIEKSSVSDSLKDLLKMNLSFSTDEQKHQLLDELIDEQKKLEMLSTDEKRMIQKYDIAMSKVGKK